MRLPKARGVISQAVITRLRGGTPKVDGLGPQLAADPTEVVLDDDLQLGLWLLYELHYRGFADVDDATEWDPAILHLRRDLERPFEAALHQLTVREIERAKARTEDFEGRLVEVIEDVEGPSLAGYLHRDAGKEQVEEFLIQRSIYHLKEADPHTFALPRLEGPAKVVLAELLYDELGAGRPERLHSALFAQTLRGAGLDATYGTYLDAVPGHTLAVNNAMSLFGLHRRLRGAAMGHLAAFEATSSLPSRHICQGLERLGYDADVRQYFDEHVEADAVHEHLAQAGICAAMVAAEPDLLDSVLFGAASCVQLDRIVAEQTIGAWEAGRSSLRAELVIA